MKDKIQKIREALNVPKEQRIAQFIYNQHREYETRYHFINNNTEQRGVGIDIFNVEDGEFINNLGIE